MHDKFYLKLVKIINFVLIVSIILNCFWIGLAPLLPELMFRIKGNSDFVMPELRRVVNNKEFNSSDTVDHIDIGNIENNRESSSTNVLIIPSINLITPILELGGIEELHTGSWIRPGISSPEKGGNTVIVAHRYTSKGGLAENTFYNLPKVVVGDKLYTDWMGHRYEYTVYEVKIVSPDDSSVEDDTLEPILTLYTCTPLWTSTERFVVRARLEKVN